MLGVLFGITVVLGVVNTTLFILTGNPINILAATACGASCGYLLGRIVNG